MNFVYSSLPVVVIDYFSKYVEVSLRRSLTSAETIRSLKSTLARHGVPDVVLKCSTILLRRVCNVRKGLGLFVI